MWVRPRHPLLAFGAHRSPLTVQAFDHLPVNAIIGTHELPRQSVTVRSRSPGRKVHGRT